MRRTWPYLVAVAAVGGVAGLAVAGRPVPADTFVIESGAAVAASTVLTVTSPVVTSTAMPTTGPAIAVTTTVVAADAPVPVPSSAPPLAIVTPSTTTTEESTGRVTATTLTVVQARVFVANATGKARLARRISDVLLAAGYTDVTATDTTRSSRTTAVYFRPGFESIATALANDIGRPETPVLPMPATSLTANDGSADVIAVLGADFL